MTHKYLIADMERKLVQVGSSLAVTLPSEVVKEFKLRKGQTVEVTVHPVTGSVTIRPGTKYFEEGKVTRRFRAMADRMRSKRVRAYRVLAR